MSSQKEDPDDPGHEDDPLPASVDPRELRTNEAFGPIVYSDNPYSDNAAEKRQFPDKPDYWRHCERTHPSEAVNEVSAGNVLNNKVNAELCKEVLHYLRQS